MANQTASINICQIYGRSRPLVHVEIPSYKTVMTATSEVVATCSVQSAFKAKLTWHLAGAAAPRQKQEENSTHIFSKLKLSPSRWKQLEHVTCKAEHKCFSTAEKTVTVIDRLATSPSVSIRRSLTGFQTGELVLLCDVRNVSAKDLCITFQGDNSDISEKLYVSLPDASGAQSVSKEFSVKPSSGREGRTYTCTVNQGFKDYKSSPVSFVVAPSVDILAPREESGPQTLMCNGSGFNPQIQWFFESKKKSSSTHSKSMGADGRVTVTNQLEITQTEWETGKDFTCEVSDTGLSKKARKDINFCSVYGRSRPSVHVEIPSYKTVMTATSEVVATCSVQSAFKAKLTWHLAGAAAPRQKQEENSTHIFSKLKLSPSRWKQLEHVTCKAEHKCFSTAEKTVTVKDRLATSPSVSIRRSLTGFQTGELVLLCDVRNVSAKDLCITFQGNNSDISEKLYVSLPDASGAQSVSKEFSVKPSSGREGRTYTCTVNQGFKDYKSSPVSFVVAPSVDILAPSEESGPQTLMCIGSGFNPQIQWLFESKKKSSSTHSKSMGADGRVTVTNQLEINQTEWETGKDFTCEVSDTGLSKNARKDINFCSATPTSSQLVSVYVHGPQAEEFVKDEQVTITCLLVGFRLKVFSIDWKVNGYSRHVNIDTKQPVSHSNGTETLHSFLNVSAKDWDAFSYISCEGKHICSNQSYESHIRRNREIHSEPSATLLQGSHELVCLATGFSPSTISIAWFLGSKQLSYDNTSDPHRGTNGTFSIQSHLNLSHFMWLPGEMIICNVTHENVTLSLNVTKSDTMEKCLFLDELLQVGVYQDISVDSWYTTITFLLLFLAAIFYSIGLTLVKTK